MLVPNYVDHQMEVETCYMGGYVFIKPLYKGLKRIKIKMALLLDI